jgi:TolB-like protein/Flp pilus assembly protein TadD
VSQPIQAADDHHAVREQMEKILAHPLFARSERMGRFLSFAVERALAGGAGALKEYLIGVEVFDRKDSFDPRVDPIVRVEARRLRAKLKSYYEGDGRSDPLVIEFQSGGYAPRFRRANAGPAPPVPAPAPGLTTIAVLPFANLGPNAENEYFSDGLTEELIHALTKVPGMRVVAWQTAARMRDRQQDIIGIGRQLNVGTVLTGSVRMGGAGLRVRAQLIDTATGIYLWSETFDRAMQDVFAIEEEIARAIVRTLRVQFAGQGEAGVTGRSRTNVEAYDWYLKGRYLWNRRTPEDLARSVECFERALAADPSSALAYAGLADAHSLLVDYGLTTPVEGVARAKAAAERSIALDPELAEPYTSLGLIRGLYEWNWEEAERLYRRAIALNPGYATAHHWLAMDHCAILGRLAEAWKEIEIAIQLDPLSAIMLDGRGWLHLVMRRYAEAVAVYRDVLTFEPSFYKAHTGIGRVYSLMGRYDEALESLEKGRSLAGDVPNILSAMGHVCGLAGYRDRARGLMAELEQVARQRFVPTTCFAIVHLGLGDIRQSLDFLEKGCELRESPLTALKVHPIYDPLRGEPRFQALLKRLRLD